MVLTGATFGKYGPFLKRSKMVRTKTLFTESLRAFYPLQVYSCVRGMISDAQFS